MRYTTEQMRDFWSATRGQGGIMVRIGFGPPTLKVASQTVEAWQALLSVLHFHDYQIRSGDTAAYNNRPITGGTLPSLHAYGVAADVNWQTNPSKKTPDKCSVIFSDKETEQDRALDVRFGRADTDMSREMIDDVIGIVSKAGKGAFAWGGQFRSTKDTMHFQRSLASTGQR